MAYLQNLWIYEIGIAEKSRFEAALQTDLARIARIFAGPDCAIPMPTAKTELQDCVDGLELKAGGEVAITGRELQLLRYLIDRRRKVVTRDELPRNM